MNINKTIVALLLSVTFLSGCSSTDEKKDGLLNERE